MESDANPIDTFAELTLESFRLNALLLAKGDELAKDVGLTSTRWQVLGTLILTGKPVTVATIAQRMGLTRQSVQRTADGLTNLKFTRYIDNPNHLRWNLVQPTAAGFKVHKKLEKRRLKWAREIVEDVSQKELNTALRVIRQLKNTIAGSVS